MKRRRQQLLWSTKWSRDSDTEVARLNKEITSRCQQEVGRINAKLGNANFIDEAPVAVVDKERQKLAN